MKKITKIALTPEQFEQNVAFIKRNYDTEDGYVFPICNYKGNAGYIVQSNNFTLTNADGTIIMFYKKEN